MNKIKISAVSYTNSKPFVYGLQHSGILNQIDLSLDNPSDCASKLIDNKVDIGLVPIAILSEIRNCEIISDYCIGADGSVDSVFIFSNKPIVEMKTLQLDAQSRTSNILSQILLKYYWKITPELVETKNADAFVQIGDRTFKNRNQYPFQYDLAEEWKRFTGLPFVFAVWASNKPMTDDFKMAFNIALKFGLDNRQIVIAELDKVIGQDMEDYLMRKIDFNLDEKKLQALTKFQDLMNSL